jgi:peptide/nickel transport system substrate-binding protein
VNATSVRRASLALAIGWLIAGGLALARSEPVNGQTASPVAGATTQADYARLLVERFALTPPETAGGTVIMADQGDITTLNAMLATDNLTATITGLVFESMVDVSAIDGTIVPKLADSFEVAADGQTYTFHLNPTAGWHDGRDLTAADVVFSYDMILDPALNSPLSSQVDVVVESYRAVDDDTFELVSAGPLASVLYDAVETVPILPSHVWSGVPPAAWPTDPGSTGADPARVVGTGPFRFSARDLGAGTTTFVPNATYWNTTSSRVPIIDRFIFRAYPDENAVVQALIAGEVDIVDAVPGPRVAELADQPDVGVATYPTLDFNFYALNLDPAVTGVFQQREVRQALLQALDREAIVATIYGGFGEVTRGTHSPLSPAYAPERIRTDYPFDPARARALLAEAGWIDTDGDGVVEQEGQPLAFAMIFPADTVGQLLAAYFQEAWAEIGVAMTPELMPFEAMFDESGPLATAQFEAILLGLGWTTDPGQGPLFACDAYEGGFNVMRYCNPEFDRLEAAQLRELDPARRRELLIEQANLVNDDVAIGMLRFAVGRAGYNERLQNFHPNGYGLLWSLPFVWVAGE